MSVIKFFSGASSTGARTAYIGQYATTAELPSATGLTDDTVAWVISANSYYRVSSDAWVASSSLGSAESLNADGTTLDVNVISDGAFLQRTGSTVVGSKAVPSGVVVGTTDVQTLTEKTLGAGTIFNEPRWARKTVTLNGGTVDIVYSAFTHKVATISADTTVTFSSLPASGRYQFVELEIVQDATGGWNITWPAAVEWLSGEAPDLANAGANEVVFVSLWTRDGGATIYGLHNKPAYDEYWEYAISDETSSLTTGTGKLTVRAPYAATLKDLRASVATAPTGANLIVDINESGTTVLSTKLTIDAGEKTSTTAATSHVISDSAIADDAELTFDIDQVGSSVAGAGLKVKLYVSRA